MDFHPQLPDGTGWAEQTIHLWPGRVNPSDVYVLADNSQWTANPPTLEIVDVSGTVIESIPASLADVGRAAAFTLSADQTAKAITARRMLFVRGGRVLIVLKVLTR